MMLTKMDENPKLAGRQRRMHNNRASAKSEQRHYSLNCHEHSVQNVGEASRKGDKKQPRVQASRRNWYNANNFLLERAY